MSTPKISREQFATIVQHEFEHEATPEAIAYLESHLLDWHAALYEWVRQNDEQLSALQVQFAQLDVSIRQTEEEKEAHKNLIWEIKNLRRMTYMLNMHIGKVNRLMKSRNQERRGKEVRTHEYREGWKHATYHMRRLLESNVLTLEQAFILCREYGKTASLSKMKDTDDGRN